jgi:hypothetical protein
MSEVRGVARLKIHPGVIAERLEQVRDRLHR